MNFTKEEAYNELVAKLKTIEANPLINERAIEAIISDDFELFKDVEMELDKYTTAKLNSLKSADGVLRKIASENISEYEKANPKTNPTITEGEGSETNPEPDSEIGKLTALVQTLVAEREESKKLASISQKKIELKNKMAELGIKDEGWANDRITEISDTEDIDVDGKANVYLHSYNKHKATYSANATPDGTSSNNGGSDYSELDEMAKRQAEKMNQNANVL